MVGGGGLAPELEGAAELRGGRLGTPDSSVEASGSGRPPRTERTDVSARSAVGRERPLGGGGAGGTGGGVSAISVRANARRATSAEGGEPPARTRFPELGRVVRPASRGAGVGPS